MFALIVFNINLIIYYSTNLSFRAKYPSCLFFQYNTQLGPPYYILVDTNFINFSIKAKLDVVQSMMDCLYAKCKSPCCFLWMIWFDVFWVKANTCVLLKKCGSESESGKWRWITSNASKAFKFSKDLPWWPDKIIMNSWST